MKLSPRLKAAADFVRCGKKIADIGTDHAHLPIYLVENKICPCAVASDVRPGPIANAKENVKQAGLEDKISLRLASGLDMVKTDEADDIVIAGMGGILIAELIEKAPWLKDSGKHLVLQPQSHAEILREFLIKNGYYIEKEEICEDAGRLYCVMSIYFDGTVRTYPEYYEYYGEIPACKNPLAKEYLQKLADRYVRDAGSMRCAEPQRAEELYNVADKLNEILSKKP